MEEVKDKTRIRSTRRKKVPEALVYERLPDGTPIYYQGYKEYIKGTKSIESIVGSGFQQSFIIGCIVKYLNLNLPPHFVLLLNEFGMKTGNKGWRNLDIAIYDRAQLKGIPRQDKYLSIPPQVVIEVDTKAELENLPVPLDYYHLKTDELLSQGVQKVIWVFTANEKIMEAEAGKDWITSGWTRTVALPENVGLNLANLMAENLL
jgi:Uma2 family endonuclease